MATVTELETAKPYFGQRMLRVEDSKYLQGRGSYVDDINLPGMLYAAMLRSPYAHARINKVDVDKAKRISGVKTVLTAAEIEKFLGFNPMVQLKWKIPEIKKIPDYRACTKDRVKFVGEVVAAVAAKDRYVAYDALEHIDIDYEPLEPIMDTEKALEKDAPKIHDELPDNLSYFFTQSNGNINAAFEEADLVLKEKLKSQRYHAAPMECRGIVSSYSPSDGKFTIWVSHQSAHDYRNLISKSLMIPENKIRVIVPDVGGGFGAKVQTIQDDILTNLLSMKTGKPVKWSELRSENFLTGGSREEVHHAEMAFRRDGTILGMKDRIFADVGAYVHGAGSGQPIVTALGLPGPYRFQNMLVELYGVYTNKVPLDAYRGFGQPEACFVHERLIDIAAKELKIDPAQVRFRNFVRRNEFPYTNAAGSVLDSGNYDGGLQKALDKIDYSKFKMEQQEALKNNRYLGLGLACYAETTGWGPSPLLATFGWEMGGYESTIIRFDMTGKVTLITGASPHGQGLHTTLAQICADELGIKFEDIEVIHGDTASSPFGIGTYGSRSAIVAGNSVVKASRKLKEKALRIAAHLLKVPPSDIEVADSRFYVKATPGKFATYEDIARASYIASDLPAGAEPGLEATAFYDPIGFAWSSGVHAVEVEVNIMTGAIKILRYVIADDCGRMINPTIVEGQVHGASAQGLGGALYEEIIYDKNGTPQNTSFMDYLVPLATEVPDYEVYHIETPSPLNPIGVKGAGEGGTIAAPAAFANAIGDALSPFRAKPNETPLTPVKIVDMISGFRTPQ